VSRVMFIVYNCGYRRTLTLQGKVTRNRYAFQKRFVTEVGDEDGEEFLKMTSKDITWCPSDNKSVPPFMSLEDWCNAIPGRADPGGGCGKYNNPTKFNPEKYKEMFLLKNARDN